MLPAETVLALTADPSISIVHTTGGVGTDVTTEEAMRVLVLRALDSTGKLDEAMDEFRRAIHAAQHIIMARPVQRQLNRNVDNDNKAE